MEKEYESILSNLTKTKELDLANIQKIKDPHLFSQFLTNKSLSSKEWNKLLVIPFFPFLLLLKLTLHKYNKEDIFQEISKLLSSQNFEVPQLSEKENSQWIQVYITIIAHYLKLITLTHDKNKTDHYLKLTSTTIAKADRINVLDSSLFVIKGS